MMKHHSSSVWLRHVMLRSTGASSNVEARLLGMSCPDPVLGCGNHDCGQDSGHGAALGQKAVQYHLVLG